MEKMSNKIKLFISSASAIAFFWFMPVCWRLGIELGFPLLITIAILLSYANFLLWEAQG